MIKRFLLILLAFIPVFQKAGNDEVTRDDSQDAVYSNLHLGVLGLSYEAYILALKGFEKLYAEGKLLNDSILTIIDFSQSSKNKRLYVIDLCNQSLLFNTYVAHGLNTGDEFAEKFSNKTGTLMSSLGFYITRNTAVGSTVGLSLILQGIEKGFNDMAERREIIIHGADYATEDFIRKNGRLGRSFGCPSLPPDLIKPVAETIKDGSCLFIYKHDEDYLCKSKVLN